MTPSCPTHAQSKKVELLAPAGTPLALEYALAYGADAVYAGLPSFSLRARNNPFTPDMLSTAIEKAHAQHRKLYITANIYPHNQKIDPFLSALDEVVASRPDALIMADPGLILLARERFPDIPLHLSVQANTLNWAAVQNHSFARIDSG
jgi:putative protease